MPSHKNLIILSEKSSGSSACQNLLAGLADVRYVSKTRHFENETLYWTKAASVLDLPQVKMVDSEVPIEREKAGNDLISLLEDNVDGYTPSSSGNARDLIMEGWRLLCEQYSPIFLEKSPHHLCQWSAIELILEFARETADVDVMLIGLVRNPMDTIYSQYKRWGSDPGQVEKQWITAYRNLGKLRGIRDIELAVVRYEDMVSSIETLNPVLEFCGVKIGDIDDSYLHRKSLQKWKGDTRFRFSLSNDAIDLAQQYGYGRDELIDDARRSRYVLSMSSQAVGLARSGLKRIRSLFRS